MSMAILPLDTMRCRRCQLILATVARALFVARRGRGTQAPTTAADGCAKPAPIHPYSGPQRP